MTNTHPSRSLPRRLGAVVGAVALAASFTVVGAQSASAASSAPVGCVHVVDSGHDWAGFPQVTVRNDCSSALRLKITWSHAPDSGCSLVSPGRTKSDTTGVFGTYSGTVRC